MTSPSDALDKLCKAEERSGTKNRSQKGHDEPTLLNKISKTNFRWISADPAGKRKWQRGRGRPKLLLIYVGRQLRCERAILYRRRLSHGIGDEPARRERKRGTEARSLRLTRRNNRCPTKLASSAQPQKDCTCQGTHPGQWKGTSYEQ